VRLISFIPGEINRPGLFISTLRDKQPIENIQEEGKGRGEGVLIISIALLLSRGGGGVFYNNLQNN